MNLTAKSSSEAYLPPLNTTWNCPVTSHHAYSTQKVLMVLILKGKWPRSIRFNGSSIFQISKAIFRKEALTENSWDVRKKCAGFPQFLLLQSESSKWVWTLSNFQLQKDSTEDLDTSTSVFLVGSLFVPFIRDCIVLEQRVWLSQVYSSQFCEIKQRFYFVLLFVSSCIDLTLFCHECDI